MRALIVAAMLFVSAGAHAANQTSVRILAFNETQMRTYWTYFLKQSNEKCDQVVRVMFQGGTTGVDSWSVACRDGNAYSVGIEPDAAGSTKIMGCAELVAIDAFLMKRAGRPPSKDVGCWVKY
jgi:hypothetical protein